MNNWIDLNALGKIVLGALICGAGLPALFALGLRALSFGAPASAPVGADGSSTSATSGGAASDRLVGGNPVGLAVAVVCFAVVLAAIAWGIYLIVAGT